MCRKSDQRPRAPRTLAFGPAFGAVSLLHFAQFFDETLFAFLQQPHMKREQVIAQTNQGDGCEPSPWWASTAIARTPTTAKKPAKPQKCRDRKNRTAFFSSKTTACSPITSPQTFAVLHFAVLRFCGLNIFKF
jgi:hypothetical protein